MWRENAAAHRREQSSYLSELIVLHQKLLDSYVCDINDYQKLGVNPASNLFVSARDNVQRLFLSLQELKEQIHLVRSGQLVQCDYTQKIERMCALNQWSIDQYHKMVDGLLSRGVAHNHATIKYVQGILHYRERINNKLHELA
jgi:hypothetical protein